MPCPQKLPKLRSGRKFELSEGRLGCGCEHLVRGAHLACRDRTDRARAGVSPGTDPMSAGLQMSAEEFEMHVAEALDEIPAELAALIDNCVILVEDYPPPDMPDTLGLYSGIPLTERGEFYTGLPDHILIFRYPILAISDTHEQVIEEIRITVVHEIAHHFGIDDDRLHELGYD
jgi:predicted Zn-dependent protease with MMP-like domain